MPIFETIASDDPRIASATWVRADVLTVGLAYARLATFVQNGATRDAFLCDAGTYSAIRKAAASIMDVERDSHTEYVKIRRPDSKSKSGWTPWTRLRKDGRVPQNAEQGVGTIHSWSGKAQREGIALLADNGVRIERDAERHTLDGKSLYFVRFEREPVENTDN